MNAGGPAGPRRGRVGGLLRSYPSRSGELDERSVILPLLLRTACLRRKQKVIRASSVTKVLIVQIQQFSDFFKA